MTVCMDPAEEDQKLDAQHTFRCAASTKERLADLGDVLKRKPSFLINEYVLAGLKRDEKRHQSKLKKAKLEKLQKKSKPR